MRWSEKGVDGPEGEEPKGDCEEAASGVLCKCWLPMANGGGGVLRGGDVGLLFLLLLNSMLFKFRVLASRLCSSLPAEKFVRPGDECVRSPKAGRAVPFICPPFCA